ncbi:MAG: hypothetical protein AMXMBFR13_28290 [Phycisphaerae bacterium]|jgi:(2Fe-2S) ferredoxin
MPKLSSLQDLTRVREEAKADRRLRVMTGTVVSVGMGTCGIAAGARETYEALEQELVRRGIQAHVASVGCIGMCVKEPLVDIRQAGGQRILYANVQPDMVARLIEQHLVKGEPVKEWVICRMPGE